MRTPHLSLIFLAGSLAFTFGQTPEDAARRFEEAARQIVRLPPAAFPELPRAVVGELQRRRCTIPQPYRNPGAPGRNVIRGSFAKPGQTDWAVLCSVNGSSSILVFWNGSARNPAEIAPQKDSGFLQSYGEDRIVYSRDLGTAGRDYVLERFRAYGGPTPPPMDHLGVNDFFVGKASIVRYFYQGKWLELQGAD